MIEVKRTTVGRGAWTAAAVGLSLLAAFLLAPSVAFAHGGRPLKLGTLEEGRLTAAVEVMRVFLVEEIGLSVKYVPYEEVAGLLGDFEEKKVEMVLLSPVGEPIDLRCGSGEEEGPAGRIGGHYRRLFPGAWVGLTGLAPPESPCAFTVVILHREIVGNLHLSTLRPALEKLFAALTAEDIDWVRSAGAGSGRDRAAAIRKLLKAKGLY